eukprot:scaffold41866_cov35-Attheya_sp.AAC.1
MPSPPCTCADDPDGWYDSIGETFSCVWYGSDSSLSHTSRCTTFGNGHRMFNKTANEACCVCGGGTE